MVTLFLNRSLPPWTDSKGLGEGAASEGTTEQLFAMKTTEYFQSA